MIGLAPRAAIDLAIGDALGRVRNRAESLGGGFPALAGAVSRAAGGGKRFRPALVTAAFESFGGDLDESPALYPVAAAFELLHTAFVIHDDVIDHDTVRRGVPNVSGEFRTRARRNGADPAGAALLGDAAAILAGDLLLHEAFRLVALADLDAATRAHLFDLFDDAVLVSAAGELADVEHSVAADLAEPGAILDATYNKTAIYSFSAPLEAGAVLAGAPHDAQIVLHGAGGRLGLAYQLVDDLIGAFGSREQAGREAGVDLRESKRTPLVALARESALWPRVSDALALAHTGPIAVREAQRVLEESGARLRLRALIDETLDEVRAASHEEALTPAAGVLLRELADGIEGRVP
ncbi:polyprenyl synthetase family protein [Microbacterium pumilum]|uniref:Polyprenyl synthetase family protein n=1 Tax=Microbacterium pumilum TaxID=344165 RepID=A0ABP5E6D7_9MICO